MISSYISENNFFGKSHESFFVSSWVDNTYIMNFEVTWACFYHCSLKLFAAVVVLEEVDDADVVDETATRALDLVRHVARLRK